MNRDLRYIKVRALWMLQSARGMNCPRCCRVFWIRLSKVNCDDGEKPSTNKTTNTRTAGVAAGATGEELSALLPSVLDKAFKGEL
jgi:hypothetical protein